MGERHWKDLLAWQKSHALLLNVYRLVAAFPKNEQYVLVDQIKRAASSVPANIVEGHSRNSRKEFLRFFLYFKGFT